VFECVRALFASTPTFRIDLSRRLRDGVSSKKKVAFSSKAGAVAKAAPSSTVTNQRPVRPARSISCACRRIASRSLRQQFAIDAGGIVVKAQK